MILQDEAVNLSLYIHLDTRYCQQTVGVGVSVGHICLDRAMAKT